MKSAAAADALLSESQSQKLRSGHGAVCLDWDLTCGRRRRKIEATGRGGGAGRLTRLPLPSHACTLECARERRAAQGQEERSGRRGGLFALGPNMAWHGMASGMPTAASRQPPPAADRRAADQCGCCV